MKFFITERGKEEDEEVVKGRKLCGGEYLTLIAMYPILTKEEIRTTSFKLFVFIGLCIATPFHLDSLRWALKTGEIDVCLENISFIAMCVSHEAIFVIVLLKRKVVKAMFKKVGSGFFKYSEPLTDEQKEIFNNKMFMFLFRANRELAILGCLVYFIAVPSLKVYVTGSWTTTTGEIGEYPYNKNIPVRLSISWDTSTATSFILTSLLVFIGVVYGALLMPCTSNIFLGYCVQICNQLQIVNLSMVNTPERARYLYKERGYSFSPESYDSKEYKKCLSYCLKENILHHVEIIKFYRSFEYIFAGWSFFQLLSFGSVISLTTYNVLQVDTSQGFLTLTAASAGKILLLSLNILHATIYCLAGQRITDLSGDLHEAYYFNGWDQTESEEFKTMVLQALAYSKNSFMIKGYGIIAANAGTLVDILRTAFSLLSFVKFVIG